MGHGTEIMEGFGVEISQMDDTMSFFCFFLLFVSNRRVVFFSLLFLCMGDHFTSGNKTSSRDEGIKQREEKQASNGDTSECSV